MTSVSHNIYGKNSVHKATSLNHNIHNKNSVHKATSLNHNILDKNPVHKAKSLNHNICGKKLHLQSDELKSYIRVKNYPQVTSSKHNKDFT